MTGAIDNLHPKLRGILVRLEERMGFELTVTSGYRDPEHNQDVGGVEQSEHTYDPAEGVDVLCKRSVTRFTMVSEALDLGVTRIGIGKDFVHLGIAADKPDKVMWTYY